jgi:hypothetical protein
LFVDVGYEVGAEAADEQTVDEVPVGGGGLQK